MTMFIKNRFLKWLTIFFVLIALETFTFFTFGLRQLKNKLLPEYFASLNHNSDSVFVRDFYTSECSTGDPNIYYSQNLQRDEKLLKEKFNVKYVYFVKDTFNWEDTIEKQFNLVYYTWASRSDWFTIWPPLFDLYSMQQTETLLTNKIYFYKREVTYHWIFFF